ncbi:hypothetical protein F0562_006406 [Nyssa sinensis]|uniref:Uncharacterized protein n=1 Tax=Nyssa sinensis TaxID=561372 RepID=A0A5J5ANT9_9ASTE|nr:hypothetical protein F0562_006406 [Nyssa sinensis]
MALLKCQYGESIYYEKYAKHSNGIMEKISRSFRLERGSSLKLGRSNSSLLASELVSSEIARITGYERLTESMRLTDELSTDRRRKNRAWKFLVKVFSFRKIGDDDVIGQPAEEKKKSRSSWFPDPHRRWPVQGW